VYKQRYIILMKTHAVHPSPSHFFTKKDIKERSFLPSNFPLLPSLWNGEFDFLHARVSLRQANFALSQREKEKNYIVVTVMSSN